MFFLLFYKNKTMLHLNVSSQGSSELLPQTGNDNLISFFFFFRFFSYNKICDGGGCCPQLEFIQTDRVVLSCVHLQNGLCDESCVTAHPFPDSPLVTHQVSHFLSAGLWSPRLKLKISRYNPFLAALRSSFCILLSSLTLQTLLCTVTCVFVRSTNWLIICMFCNEMHNLWQSSTKPNNNIFETFG